MRLSKKIMKINRKKNERNKGKNYFTLLKSLLKTSTPKTMKRNENKNKREKEIRKVYQGRKKNYLEFPPK